MYITDINYDVITGTASAIMGLDSHVFPRELSRQWVYLDTGIGFGGYIVYADYYSERSGRHVSGEHVYEIHLEDLVNHMGRCNLPNIELYKTPVEILRWLFRYIENEYNYPPVDIIFKTNSSFQHITKKYSFNLGSFNPQSLLNSSLEEHGHFYRYSCDSHGGFHRIIIDSRSQPSWDNTLDLDNNPDVLHLEPRMHRLPEVPDRVTLHSHPIEKWMGIEQNKNEENWASEHVRIQYYDNETDTQILTRTAPGDAGLQSRLDLHERLKNRNEEMSIFIPIFPLDYVQMIDGPDDVEYKIFPSEVRGDDQLDTDVHGFRLHDGTQLGDPILLAKLGSNNALSPGWDVLRIRRVENPEWLGNRTYCSKDEYEERVAKGKVITDGTGQINLAACTKLFLDTIPMASNWVPMEDLIDQEDLDELKEEYGAGFVPYQEVWEDYEKFVLLLRFTYPETRPMKIRGGVDTYGSTNLSFPTQHQHRTVDIFAQFWEKGINLERKVMSNGNISEYLDRILVHYDPATPAEFNDLDESLEMKINNAGKTIAQRYQEEMEEQGRNVALHYTELYEYGIQIEADQYADIVPGPDETAMLVQYPGWENSRVLYITSLTYNSASQRHTLQLSGGSYES